MGVHKPSSGNAKGTPTPLLSAAFTFDDHIRCMAAKQRLTKGRTKARQRKMHLIAKLLELPDMVDHFTDYKGFTKDYGSDLAFVKKKFHEESSPRRQRMIYTHETCATDTAGMKFVFEAVRDTILQLNLRQYNLV